MLFGGHRREELVSPTFCPQRNNVRTVAPVGGSPVPWTSGAQQKMMDTVACSPLPNSSLTRANGSFDQCSHGQQTFLPWQHFHTDLSSNKSNCQRHLSKTPNDAFRSGNVNVYLKSPILVQLLTTNNSKEEGPLSHQSNTTPRPTAETSVNSTNSKTIPSCSKQYLDDDQILKLIEKKLAIYRAQMKVSKERGSSVKDSMNIATLSSCSQDPATSMSAPRALEDRISKDSEENEPSDCSRQSPEQSTMKNDGTVTAKQPTEYVGIMQEAAAICSKKEGESPVVLQGLGSCATVDELVKRSPALTLHHKPSNQEYKSMWRNGDPLDLSKSTETSLAFETSDVNCKPEQLKDPKYDDITDDEQTPQLSTLNTPLQNKDICEDHLSVQLSGHLVNAESSMVIQLDDISDDDGPVTGNGSIQVGTPRLPEQSSMLKGNCFPNAKRELAVTPSLKQQLVCTCHYVDDDDGEDLKFVQCQKCIQDVSSLNQEEDASPSQDGGSKDCEDAGLASGCSQSKTVMDSQCEVNDEWIVIPLMASDVKLVTLDHNENGNEENQYPSSLEQRNEPSQPCFQKIQKFDDIFSFHKAMSMQFNCKITPEAINTASSEFLPASCNLPKLKVAEKSASEPASTPGTEAEDSCDTDDSSDYPLMAKRNYLTASSRARAPSFLASSSDSEDEGEVPQSPETITPRPPPESTSSFNNFFPVISADEDEDSTNNAGNDTTVTPIVAKRLCKETSPNKEKEHKTKTSKKKRLKSSELNQESNLGQTGNSSKSGKASILPKQPTLQPGRIQPRPAQNGQNPSSVSNKASSHGHKTQVVKRKNSSTISTSDHNRNGQGKRKRPFPDAAGSPVQKRPANALANHKTSNQNPATKKSSETRKKDLVQRKSLPSQRTSTQSNALFSIKARESGGGYPVTETLSLNGEKYQASSLPGGHKQNLPQSSLISKTKRVNSYSTTNSTPAKQRIVNQWAKDHVPTREEGRGSFDRDASTRNAMPKTASGKDHKMREPVQRQRSNSRETPLMKRSMSEARQWTHHAHRQASTELNPDNRYDAYKWAFKGTPATNDFDWERERDSPKVPKGLTEL